MTAAAMHPPIKIASSWLSVMPVKSTDSVRISDSITSAATTTPVKRLRLRDFAQGPSTARSLQSSSRKTDALGSSTPASVCTALVKTPSGVPGASTSAVATTIKPK